MTWKEMKDSALQLMYSYSQGGTVLDNSANSDFLLAMAAPANTALRDLAGVCPIRREITIKQYKEDNIYAQYAEEDDEITITAQAAQSFYAEIEGNATVYFEFIQSDDSVILLYSEVVENGFYAPVRYVYDQAYDNVQVRIAGGARVRSYAFYGREYKNWEVPSPGNYQTYSLSGIIARQSQPAFFKMAERPVRLTHGDFWDYDISGYVAYDGKDKLSVPSDIEGEIKVHYFASPAAITPLTLDAFEIELDCEACDIIPYYIASVVYAEDDLNLAKQYRDEYYSRRNAIAKPAEFLAPDEFVSASGW